MLLFDSNVLIEASRLYYSVQIAPTFWDWLGEQHRLGNIASVQQVRKEINDGKHWHLRHWAAALPGSFWLTPGGATRSLTELAAWVTDPKRPYTQAARNEFLNIADYFIVAVAHAGGHEVVTREHGDANSKKRVLIPDACNAMGVRHREPFSVFRELGLQFQ